MKNLKVKSMIKVIIAIIIAGGVASGAYFYIGGETKQEAKSIEMVDYNAIVSTITKSLDSSGTIESFEQFDIVSLVSGDILSDFVEVSTMVEKDAILYNIDSGDLENNIKKAENSLTKQQTSYQEVIDSQADLNIKSKLTGVITELYIKVGDTVSSQTKICDIIDTSTLTLTIPFHATQIGTFNIGSTATVNIEEAGESITGKITGIATGTYVSSNGSLVTDIEIEVSNPAVLTDSYIASAEIHGIQSADVAVFQYKNSTTIYAGTTGDISKLNVMKGDKISNGTVIAVATNDSLATSIQNAKFSLEDAQLSYDSTVDQLNDYAITSPITGTIIEKKYKEGDTIEGSKTTLAVVADMSKVKFTMEIDELNIKTIEQGADVIVTADAIDGVTYHGYVSSIGLIGTQSQGVTTYPVEVVIDEPEGLLPSMNVTAVIVTEKAENVITVPTAYVARNNLVLITEDDAEGYQTSERAEVGKIMENANAPEGYKYLCVSTGLTDGTVVEITEGIKEGTTVYMQVVALGNATQQDASPFGNMGNMGDMSSGMGGMNAGTTTGRGSGTTSGTGPRG